MAVPGRFMDIEHTQGVPPDHGTPLYRAEFEGEVSEKNRVIAEVISRISEKSPHMESEFFSFRLCLDEAIQNAITHGNHNDRGKKVTVSLWETEEGWELMVKDEGTGFRPQKVPDPRERGYIGFEGGRGILILTEYMDGIKYYEGGRTLVISKHDRQKQSSR